MKNILKLILSIAILFSAVPANAATVSTTVKECCQIAFTNNSESEDIKKKKKKKKKIKKGKKKKKGFFSKFKGAK